MHDHRLDARQMAQFITHGFLVFPAIIPEEINQRAIASFSGEDERLADAGYTGERLATRYSGHVIGDLLELPAVAGIIQSTVGPDPILDHHCLHTQHPRSGPGGWHQDAVIDAKRHFDIQLLYFPHHTPREMGGTMVLPGSHLRVVNVFEPFGHQNFVGQAPTVCPAGSLAVVHHGIWHCAQANRTERKRYMFKLRIAARVPQVRLFRDADRPDPEIARILSHEHAWMGTDSRLEVLQRARLWRLLTGDPTFDVGYYLGRLENDPFTAVPQVARGWAPLDRRPTHAPTPQAEVSLR